MWDGCSLTTMDVYVYGTVVSARTLVLLNFLWTELTVTTLVLLRPELKWERQRGVQGEMLSKRLLSMEAKLIQDIWIWMS